MIAATLMWGAVGARAEQVCDITKDAYVTVPYDAFRFLVKDENASTASRVVLERLWITTTTTTTQSSTTITSSTATTSSSTTGTSTSISVTTLTATTLTDTSSTATMTTLTATTTSGTTSTSSYLKLNTTRILSVDLGGESGQWHISFALTGGLYDINIVTGDIHKVSADGSSVRMPTSFPQTDKDALFHWDYCATDLNKDILFCVPWPESGADQAFVLNSLDDTLELVQWWQGHYAEGPRYDAGKFVVFPQERSRDILIYDTTDKSTRNLEVPQSLFNKEWMIQDGWPTSLQYTKVMSAGNGFVMAFPAHDMTGCGIALHVASENISIHHCRTREQMAGQPHRGGFIAQTFAGGGKLYAVPQNDVKGGMVFDTTTRECWSVMDPFGDFGEGYGYFHGGRQPPAVGGKYYLVPAAMNAGEHLKIHIFDPNVGFTGGVRELSSPQSQSLKAMLGYGCPWPEWTLVGDTKIIIECHWSSPATMPYILIDTETDTFSVAFRSSKKARYATGAVGQHFILPPSYPDMGSSFAVWSAQTDEVSEHSWPTLQHAVANARSTAVGNELYISPRQDTWMMIFSPTFNSEWR